MFARIAPRYDLVNRILTGGIDLYWRNLLTRRVAARKPKAVVDLATGSGDVAFALQKKLGPDCALTGIDFCQPMLDQALKRQEKKNSQNPIVFRQGDILKLEVETESIDVVTISFGLRNLADRAQGLAEIHRILRPGGELVILEFTQPYRWLRPFYFFYLRRILPYLAGFLSGDLSAYRYLNKSIEAFPDRAEISAELKSAGFVVEEARPLTGGIVCLHRGLKGQPTNIDS